MSRKSHVLVIEDNSDQVYLIRLGLEKCIPGVNVAVVSDEAGVATYFASLEQQDSVAPQLILLDLYMPLKQNGLRILAYIKAYFLSKQRPATPVIILSYSDQPDDIKECYDLGVNAYMIKPIKGEDLLALFRTLRIYWLETVTLPLKK
ncbi:response regulator [Spirosoma flavum]|uniref:Response regulator n=1 Tax=Spirosoma flavum TaxID=2048557 RepID=A0ABW6AIT7_9BACT